MAGAVLDRAKLFSLPGMVGSLNDKGAQRWKHLHLEKPAVWRGSKDYLLFMGRENRNNDSFYDPKNVAISTTLA